MYKYILTLDSSQAKETLKAVELLIRLKINQPHEITRALMNDDYYWDNETVDKKKFSEFIDRRDKADKILDSAFENIYPPWDRAKKDEEWYRLYNIFQALRYQIHLAETPNSTGVDSYPPIKFTDEPIPKCEWREING